MKHTKLFTIAMLVLLSVLVLAACAEEEEKKEDTGVLNIVIGETTKTFTVDDLKALPQTNATINDVEYVGVQIPVLLEAAGIDPTGLTALKATASDGFSVNYEPSMYSREDVILAYALPDGPMSENDGNFRMVLPGEEGKLNPRMVVELKAVK